MKNINTNEIKSIKKDDITGIELYRSTRAYAMRIYTSNNIVEINGVLEEMIEEIKKSVSGWYSMSVHVKELEVSETTKGQVTFSNECLEYRKDKLIFDIPLKEITSVFNVKNEVVLGFETHDDTEGVCEMRLTVPDDNFVESLRLRSEAGLSKSIFTFSDMTNVSPRGKSNYIFNQNCLRIIGGTFEHKVLYSSIKRIFLFEGEKNANVVVEVNPSIKQGFTRYDFVNVMIEKELEEEFTIEVEDNIKEKFPDLMTTYTGELYKTFTTAMELFTNK